MTQRLMSPSYIGQGTDFIYRVFFRELDDKGPYELMATDFERIINKKRRDEGISLNMDENKALEPFKKKLRGIARAVVHKVIDANFRLDSDGDICNVEGHVSLYCPSCPKFTSGSTCDDFKCTIKSGQIGLVDRDRLATEIFKIHWQPVPYEPAVKLRPHI